MRIGLLFLTLVFASGLIDFPIPQQAYKKCCCSGASFCHCKQMQGMCPLKKKSMPVEKDLAPQDSRDKTPGFKAFGCGSKQEASVSPTYFKEFFLKGPAKNFTFQTPQPFFEIPVRMHAFYTDQRIDQPPRLA